MEKKAKYVKPTVRIRYYDPIYTEDVITASPVTAPVVDAYISYSTLYQKTSNASAALEINN